MASIIMAGFEGRPIRLTEIGVPKVNLRGYGAREDLERVAGLDIAGVMRRLSAAIRY
jgi:hypothetical protein